VPVLPSLAVKALYWRVCALCFTLGCARPESLGLFLWTAYPPVKSLMLMAISSRFSSSAESLAEEYVGTKETEAALRLRTAITSGVEKPLDVLKHLDSNGVELYITAEHLEARYGRVQDVEAALGRLEEALGTYLFGEVPSPVPVGAVKMEAEVEGSVGLNGKRTRSVAIDDLVAIHEERERQGQKREVERGARAERAAARLQRDALSVSLDSSRESDSRSSGIEALMMLAGASSSLSEGAVTVSTESSSSSSSSGTGVSGVNVSASVSVEAESLSSLLKKRQRAGDPSELAGEASSTLSSAMTVTVAGAVDAPSDSLLRSEDTAVVAEEVSLALFVIPKLSSKSAPPYSTVRGSVDVGDVMIMRCEGVSRVPPEDVIKAVRALSVRFGFGAKLRGCTEPDFITRAISGEGEEVLGLESSSAALGGGGRGEDDSTPRKPVAAHVIDLTAEPDLRNRSTSTSITASSSSAAVLRVSRPAVEASFSWLVPAISEDADAILKRYVSSFKK
jgi:hypothetical protein